MRVCSHGCLVRRATGGTVWWSRRDSNPRPSRCERDALPLRHGPMPVPTYAGRADRKRSHSGGGVTPLVPSAGFEPATPTLGGWRSIPWATGAGGGRLKLGLGAGRLDSIPLIRAPDGKAARRSAPAFALLPGARVSRLRACATAAGMLQHSSVFHGTSCVPTCPRPDSNRRRPPPEGGALSAELQGRMPPPRDDARKRPPDRRHAHRTSGTRRPCGMAAFPSVRWCFTRVPRGRF